VHWYLLNAFQYFRASINYLLVNLAVADVLYAAFMVPRFFFQFSFKHPDGETGTVLCKLLTAGIAAWVGAASSVITLAAIAVERYYAVTYPLGNRAELTKRKLKVGHLKKDYPYDEALFDITFPEQSYISASSLHFKQLALEPQKQCDSQNTFASLLSFSNYKYTEVTWSFCLQSYVPVRLGLGELDFMKSWLSSYTLDMAQGYILKI